MKKKLSLLIALSALTLSVGAAVGVGAGLKYAEEAKAEEKTLYLDNTAISNDSAKYWFHAWGGGVANAQDDWLHTAENGLLSATLSSDAYANIIFIRVSPDTDTFIWKTGGAWNQTGDLNIPTDGKNTFVLNSDCESGSWTTRESTANGCYLRGIINGAEAEWNENVVRLSGLGNPVSGKIGLKAGDEIQAVFYKLGKLEKWLNVESVNSTDEFPAYNWDGHAKVEKEATYWVTLNFNGNYDGQGNEYWIYNVIDEASGWAEEFLGSMTCYGGSGHQDLKWHEGYSWSYFADAENGTYAKLGDIAKNALYGATAADEGSAIVRAAKRHDAIVAHYDWATAFMKNSSGVARGLSLSFPFVVGSNSPEATNYTAVIILASTLALIAVGGYFLLRKARKED